jgi:hypothetical protein
MKLISAKYGGLDCYQSVLNHIHNNILSIRSSNDIIGDPIPGQIKFLDLQIEDQYGDSHSFSIKEGEWFFWPKSNHKKLGIFYSNNTNKKLKNCVDTSLQSIFIASEGKADILKSVWETDRSSLFPEFKFWYNKSGHLSQLLQVLHLLYQAEQHKDYEYVSFLEHDVMYPKGYFDYPDFSYGEVLTNMNFIGLSKKGWQHVNGNSKHHEPFHQMTMRFFDAVKHCERILKNALLNNSGCIEPDFNTMARSNWSCLNPAVHINHGVHFTSHFQIYSNEDLYPDDKYWGHYSQYLNCFNT